MRDIERFSGVCEVGSIGQSFLGKEIPYVKVGSGKRVIVQGGMHAREWVTTVLVVKMIERAVAGAECEFYFVPCTNPDGLDISQIGTADKQLIEINGGHDFSLWKANARAVDVNVNFDAKYGFGKSNVQYPSSANYIGQYAHSELETNALIEFTQRVKPRVTISYHAMGREVYWEFGQVGDRKTHDREYASKIAEHLGYKLVDDTGTSVGGYKDWCIMHGITALTIEIIDDSICAHPLCERDLAVEIKRNLQLLSII